MVRENHITIPQLAKLLGVSRIAIYKKVKNGQIPAKKAGKIYIISDSIVADILGKKLSLQKGNRQQKRPKKGTQLSPVS